MVCCLIMQIILHLLDRPLPPGGSSPDEHLEQEPFQVRDKQNGKNDKLGGLWISFCLSTPPIRNVGSSTAPKNRKHNGLNSPCSSMFNNCWEVQHLGSATLGIFWWWIWTSKNITIDHQNSNCTSNYDWARKEGHGGEAGEAWPWVGASGRLCIPHRISIKHKS